ncbi:MAG: LPS export ABC transporter periplasmic protein LptC [Thermodesulfobacteriota bacterium]
MKYRELERWHRLNLIKKALQVLVIAAAVASVAVFLAGKIWTSPPETIVAPPEPTRDDGMTIRGFQYSSPGPNPWELKAESATVSEALDKIVLVKPQVVYHGANGEGISLSADRGDLDRDKGDYSMRGNVVVRHGDFVYETDAMEYSDKSRQAKTSSPISLKGPDILVTGTGLTVDVDRQELVIEKDVKSTLFNVKWVDPGERLPL